MEFAFLDQPAYVQNVGFVKIMPAHLPILVKRGGGTGLGVNSPFSGHFNGILAPNHV